MKLVEKLPEKKKNVVYHISIYVGEALAIIGGLPICEVRELPDRTKRIHYVSDTRLQKLFELFHRYGPNPKLVPDRSLCPYTDNTIRARMHSVIPQPGPLTTYQHENQSYRKTLIEFLRKNTLTLQTRWKAIAEQWVDEMGTQGVFLAHRSANLLTGKFIIEGICGYTPCTDIDAKINYEFWETLFEPTSSQLHPLEEQRKSSGLFSSFSNVCEDLGDNLSKLKAFSFDRKKVIHLARNIIKFGLSEEGLQNINFPAACFQAGFTKEEIEGFILTLMVAAQGTVSALIAALLYEYAKAPMMQEIHREQIQEVGEFTDCSFLKNMEFGIYRAYLEALRIYPPAGAQREAAHDMKICFDDQTHYIRKGDIIAPLPILQGRNPDIWVDPNRFDPDREGLEDVKKVVVPFGSGAHACPGERGASTEILITLATVLPRLFLYQQEEMPPLTDETIIHSVNDFKIGFRRLEEFL